LHASGFGRENFSGEPKFELYDLSADPRESKNLYATERAVAMRLQAEYDRWFDDVGGTRPNNYAPPRIHVGSPRESETALTRQDWRGGTWQANSIGHWELHVLRDGPYDVDVLFDARATSEQLFLRIGDVKIRRDVKPGADSVSLAGVKLPTGDQRIQAELRSATGKPRGVYQVLIKAR
jgi:hypothetical protein